VKVALLLATIVSASLNWGGRLRRDEGLQSATKPLTTFLLILLAIAGSANGVQTSFAVAALMFCLIGDVALMPMFDHFVVGLGAFLLGHLVFIALFDRYGLDSPALGALAVVAAGLMAATVGRRIVVGAAEHAEGLRLPVTAYLTVICAMTVAGWATGRWIVVLGTLLFVVSDSILGWERFVRAQAWMSLAVMVTYHGAIGLLALSLW